MTHTSVRECPLCGGSMRIKQREHVTQVPGNPRATTTRITEWVCPDCDYFEEDDGESG